MKKIHLTLLLAGLLAVGSAFTTKQAHKLACFNLDDAVKYHHISAGTAPEDFISVVGAPAGVCEGEGTCLWYDSNDDQIPDTPCDDSPEGLYNTGN